MRSMSQFFFEDLSNHLGINRLAAVIFPAVVEPATQATARRRMVCSDHMIAQPPVIHALPESRHRSIPPLQLKF